MKYNFRVTGRNLARLSLVVGIGASVAANVAHAHPQIGPRLTAGIVPAALWLVVEMIARVDWKPGRRWILGRWIGAGAVASVAAVASYVHQRELFHRYGETWLTASIIPLAIDGLLLVASTALAGMRSEVPAAAEPSPAASGWTVWATLGAPAVPELEIDPDPRVYVQMLWERGLDISGEKLGPLYGKSGSWGRSLLRTMRQEIAA